MKKVFFVLIFLAFFLVFSQVVHATTIFSPLLEIEAEPGEIQNGIVKLFNETDEDLLLISSIEPFSAGDETGQPIFLVPEIKDEYLNWFEIELDSILLRPKQVVIVPFSIDVPANAVPGGYYSAIFWQEVIDAPEGISPIGVSGKVGTLIFLKVKGDILEKGEVVEFSAFGQKKYFFELPISFITRFENSGNIHLKPTGQIKIKGMFGQEEIIEINSGLRNVMPNSIRRFDVFWGESLGGNFLGNFWQGLKQDFSHFAFGRYKATLSLTYGFENPIEVSQEISFWLISYRMIIALVVIIFVLLILLKTNKKIKKLRQSGKKKLQ